MLSAPPRPSTPTDPPGRRSPNAPFRARSPQSFSEDPGAHWVHSTTSNPIESSVSTLRLWTRVTRGLSRDRPVSPSPTHSSLRGPLASGNGSHLVVVVRADATFRKGGGGRVGPRASRVADGAAGRADSEVWGFIAIESNLTLRVRGHGVGASAIDQRTARQLDGVTLDRAVAETASGKAVRWPEL
jgi:hypothetical protein